MKSHNDRMTGVLLCLVLLAGLLSQPLLSQADHRLPGPPPLPADHRLPGPPPLPADHRLPGPPPLPADLRDHALFRHDGSPEPAALLKAPRLQELVCLTYDEYIELVLAENLGYAAEKYEVSIAAAQAEAARVFQDPTISFDWSGTGDESGYSTEIEKTFEIGKRRARINLALSEKQLTQAMLADFLRNLRADATLDYLDAMRHVHLYEVMFSSWEMLSELARADSIRLSLGSIMAIDASQSSLEAGMMYNELLQIEAGRINSFVELSSRMSRHHADTLYCPAESFGRIERDYSLEELIAVALENRSDLVAARYNIDYSRDQLALVKAERRADIGLKAGAAGSGPGRRLAGAPPSEITAGIAIPLKFSHINRGELKMAGYQLEQSELLYLQAEREIGNEVVKAYNLYQALMRQVANFDLGLLDQARMVLEGKAYSYSRGETSLLEVLNAQRTYNDLQISYYETLFSGYAALVELERSAGVWDIIF